MRRWGRENSPPLRPGVTYGPGRRWALWGVQGPRPWPRTWTGAPVEALWGVTAQAHCRQMQSRSLAGPVCIWTGLLTCSQDIRSVVRLTSPVSVGPRRAVVHHLSPGLPRGGGLPDGTRVVLCGSCLDAVRLTSPVSVGPRRGVAHPVSLGKPSRGGLPDGSRGKLCTMSLRNVLGPSRGTRNPLTPTLMVPTLSKRKELVSSELSLATACGLQVRGRRQWIERRSRRHAPSKRSQACERGA